MHDHPHMTVLSTLVRGSLDVQAYSPCVAPCAPGATSAASTDESPWRALPVAHKGVASPTWLLTPTDGNMHTFVSTHSECCVVFDVLLPPYSVSGTEAEAEAEEGAVRRVCTYYAVNEEGGRGAVGRGEERIVTLRPVPPSGALPVGVMYEGFKPIL